MISMLVLVIFSIYFIANNGLDILIQNWKMPLQSGGILKALILGFSAAMLGISGFESSANFVEEQDKGVFPKTLKNMWIAVSVLNPLMAILAISIMPLSEVNEYKNSFLSHMAELTGGKYLATLISINAVTVLSGAVLTSFVGVNGLIKRMTLDRILPNYFLKENKKGSTYRILALFFLLCISVLFVTNGEIGPLAGVYALSFLTVMAFFAIGNILLKLRRTKLPRPEIASPFSVLIATVVGIPMYADIFGTLPIAEALFAKGVGVGTILSFMMGVTALSLPSMIMLNRVVKKKLLAVFIGVVASGIIIIGYFFNAFSFLII